MKSVLVRQYPVVLWAMAVEEKLDVVMVTPLQPQAAATTHVTLSQTSHLASDVKGKGDRVQHTSNTPFRGLGARPW
jgi:hypothetical protein